MASILKVDKLQVPGTSTDALTIDSSGRILTPARPSWRVGINGSQSMTQGSNNIEIINFTQSTGTLQHLEGGCTLSGGKITVPVAGVYHASAIMRMDSLTANTYHEMHIRHETTSGTQTEIAYVISGNPATNYENATASVTVKMEANEKLLVSCFSADSSYTVSASANFSGFLVG
jgi:hypothetical protein